jgi:hypothetical protein
VIWYNPNLDPTHSSVYVAELEYLLSTLLLWVLLPRPSPDGLVVLLITAVSTIDGDEQHDSS